MLNTTNSKRWATECTSTHTECCEEKRMVGYLLGLIGLLYLLSKC